MNRALIEIISLFFAGLLAGEEFIVRYGLSALLAALDDQSHIRLRQLLIRKLRVIVPAIFFAATLSGIAMLFFSGPAPGPGLRYAGIFALLIWISVTLSGTVPINKNILQWDAKAPPANWKIQIGRWQRLDTFRAWAAILAFGLFLVSASTRF